VSNTPGYYIYLISSLPALQFGEKAPFSFREFLEKCKGLIPQKDIGIIKSATFIEESPYDETRPILRKWRAFDAALRNELVKIRASRKHVDPNAYLRRDGYADPSVANVAMNAYKNPSMLESEEILDRVRWWVLDEITIGHYFDTDFLITYGHKLLILEKWDKIRVADKTKTLEEVLTKT